MAAKDIGDKVAEVGVKVECVDETVQVLVDGARGVQSVLKTFKHIYIQTTLKQEQRHRKQE